MKFSFSFSNVRSLLSASLACAALVASNSLHAAVVINEVDSSTVQTAAFAEGFQFIELKGTPGESLNGCVVALFNGAFDTVYRTIDLTGYVIPPDGLLVIGNPGVPNVDVVLPQVIATGNPQTAPNDDTIQPGPDAIALFKGVTPASFLTGSPVGPVTVYNMPAANLVDAVVYSSVIGALDDPELLLAFTPGKTQINEGGTNRRLDRSIGRTGTNLTGRDTSTYKPMSPTPGQENVGNGVVVAGAEAIFPSFVFVDIPIASQTTTEGAGVVNGTIRLCNDNGTPLNAPAGGVTVTLNNTDPSEITGLPATVTIPAGMSAVPFSVTSLDDLQVDGTQIAFIQANAVGYGGHTCWVNVQDNDTVPPNTLTINEIQGHVFEPSAPFPAGANINGDAVVDGKDQFVEIVNTGSVVQDISNFTLRIGDTMRHTFPPCTLICPGQALLVVGGGVTDGSTSAFGGTPAFNATTGSLAIPTGISQVRLLNTANLDVLGLTSFSLEGGSQTRKPGATGAVDNRLGSLANPLTGFDPTARTAAAAALWASAGLKFDGTPFGIEPAMILTTCNSASELKGANAATLTITRPAGDSNQTIGVLVTFTQTAAGGDLNTLRVQDNFTTLDNPLTCVNDALSFPDDPTVELLPSPYPPKANSKTYCVTMPAGEASHVLNLATVVDANTVDEVYTFSAVTSCHANTTTSTAASLTVIETGTLTMAVTSNPLFWDQFPGGSMAISLNLGARPAPALPVTINEYRTSFVNAATDFGICPLPVPASHSDFNATGVTVTPPTTLNPTGTVTVNVAANVTDNRIVCVSAMAACDTGAVPETYSGETSFTIVKEVVINEVFNGANSFVEIVNNSGQIRSLDGWKLAVNGVVKHTFTNCSILCPTPAPPSATFPIAPTSALLVFENATGVTPGVTAANGSAMVEVAGSSFGLAANATVELRKPDNSVYNRVCYVGATAGNSDSRMPDGSGVARQSAAPSPGFKNGTALSFGPKTNTITLAFAQTCIAEVAPENTTVLTVTRIGSTAQPAEVCLTNSNPNIYKMAGEVGGKLTVIIPATSTSTTVTITAATPALLDTQKATISSIADCYLNAAADLTVTKKVVINEIVGGANPYIELVNNTARDFDLSGWKLSVNGSVKHIFPVGVLPNPPSCSLLRPIPYNDLATTLTTPPHSALVVFQAGGVEGITPANGTALIQNANNGPLGLVAGAVVRLLRPDNSVYYESTFNGLAGSDSRIVDGCGVGLVGAAATPGMQNTAAGNFSTVTETVTLTFGQTCIAELSGANATTLTVTRSGPTTLASEICLTNSNPAAFLLTGESGGKLNVTLPVGSSSTVINVSAVDSTAGNGDRSATVSSIAPGYFNATSASLLVKDSGTLALSFRANSICENAGPNASTLTITRASGAAACNIVITPLGTGGATLNGPLSTSFGAGVTTLNIPIDAVPDSVTGLNRTMQFQVIADAACGCLNALSPVLTIFDDGGQVRSAFINEIDVSGPCGENAEFVELFVAGGGGKSLNGYTIAFFDTGSGVPYFAQSLTGFTTDANGFFLLWDGDTAAGRFAPVGGIDIHNTPMAVALYCGPIGANLTNNLVDALVINGAAPALQAALTPGQGFKVETPSANGPGSISRMKIGGEAALLPVDLRSDATWQATTNSTPALPNATVITNTIGLVFGQACIAELSGANATTLTVSRTGPTTLPVQVCLTNNNPTAFTLAGEVSGKLIVTLPAGTATSAPINVSAVDSTPGNGDRSGTVSSIAQSYLDTTSASLLVKDSGTLTMTYRATSIVENAGPNASLLSITRASGAAPCNVAINLMAGTGAVLRAPVPTSFPAGVTTLNIPVDAVNDPAVQGTRTITVTAIADAACGCLNATSSALTVIDDGGVIEGAYINEIDVSQPGADTAEFVEIFVPGGVSKSLNGYTLAFIDAGGAAPYFTLDLTGKTTDANGFFVLWDAGVGSGRFAPVGGIDIHDTPMAVALYRGPVGVNLSNNIVDGLVINGAAASLQAAITPGTPLPNEVFKTETPVNDGPCVIARKKIGGEAALLPVDLRVAATWEGLVNTNRTPGFPNADSLGGYNAWAQSFPGIGVNTADFDGDGIPNGVEYVLGTDPTSGATPMPMPTLVGGPGGFFQYILTLSPDAACDPHAQVTAECSEDMLTWTPMTEVSPGVFNSAVGSPCMFFRLRVTFIP